MAAKAAGPRKRLRCLVLDDPRSVCLGNEPVRVGGEVVGRVTSGGYGFAVERSIAYAYLPPDRAAIGTRGEVEVFGDWIGFEVAREPLYDPTARGSGRDATRRARPSARTGRPRSGAAPTPSCAAGWTSRSPPATRRTSSPGGISGATSRSSTKPDKSFVTQADTAIERMIRGRLLDAFPDHGLVGEEYGSEAADASIRWYIDPIDGTHNFIRGVPLFGTLLAVERDGELQAAVLSAPGARRALVGAGGAAGRGRATGARPPGASRCRASRRMGDALRPLRLGPRHRRRRVGRRASRPSSTPPGGSAASATSGATRWSPRAPPRR